MYGVVSVRVLSEPYDFNSLLYSAGEGAVLAFMGGVSPVLVVLARPVKISADSPFPVKNQKFYLGF